MVNSPFDRNDFIFLHAGILMQTHPVTACVGRSCCVHNPSDHPLRDAPLHWRGDLRLMERMCSHGVGHPDPDDLAWKRVTLGEDEAWGFGVHGCDGCCRHHWTPTDVAKLKEEWK